MFRYTYYKHRIPELDFLRGIAILLVLCSHYYVIGPFRTMWMGVDLFFVLSGFLVAGLLIKEFKRSGKVRVRRFLIRRGLKIYPSFYFYLFFTLALIGSVRAFGIPITRVEITWQAVVSEIFYLQNYWDNIWGHDWSLAVEEHFYFLLAGSFLLFQRSRDMVGLLFRAAWFLLPVVLIMRILTIDHSPGYEDGWAIYATHLRIDSLLSGVIIACIYHSRYKALKRLGARFWAVLTIAGIALVAGWLAAFPEFTDPAVKFGYTVIYTGFAMVVLGSMMLRDYKIRWWDWFFQRSLLVNLIAMIGVYSYNIYLWHMFSLDIFYAVMYASTGADILHPLAWRYFLGYMGLSLFLGIVTAILIEIPVLKWRDQRYA